MDRWEAPEGLISRFRGKVVDIRTRKVVATCEAWHDTFLAADEEARALSQEHPYSGARVVHAYVKE